MLISLTSKKSPLTPRSNRLVHLTSAVALTISLGFVGYSVSALANETDQMTIELADNDPKLIALLNANLGKSGIDVDIFSAEQIGNSGLYWVQGDGIPPFLTNTTGEYVIQGQVNKIGEAEPIDITERLNNQITKEQIARIPLKDMIIYPSTSGTTKGVVNVFTDANCPYCKKLHSHIDEINALGIEVRYLASPRSPADMAINEAIWCSADRNLAMTNAKKGIAPTTQTCDSPVVEHTQLGNALGIPGTPAVFTEDGMQVGGYLTPADFVEIFELD